MVNRIFDPLANDPILLGPSGFRCCAATRAKGALAAADSQ
jgi:hypothetical protein